MSNDITDEERAIIDGLQMGTPEEAVAALRALRGQVATPANAAEEKLKFIDYVDKFRREYPDVTGDPEAYELCKQVDTALAEKHPELGYWDRLSLAGNVVREKLADADSDAIAQIALSRRVSARARDDDGNIIDPQEAARVNAALAERRASRQRSAPSDVEKEIEEDRARAMQEAIKGRRGRLVENFPRLPSAE